MGFAGVPLAGRGHVRRVPAHTLPAPLSARPVGSSVSQSPRPLTVLTHYLWGRAFNNKRYVVQLKYC